MDKTECGKLFEEYKEIKSRIDASTRLNTSGKIELNPAFPMDEMKRYYEIAVILKNNCKDYIDLETYHEIETDVETSLCK